MTTLILAASGRGANTGPITAIHLTLIAVLMVVAVAVIFWGAIQKRRRAKSAQEAQERQAEMVAAPARADAAPADPTPAPAPGAVSSRPRPAPAEAAAADPAPAAVPPPPPVPSSGEAIPLTRLKGLGPKAAALLGERGIADVATLAALSDRQAAEIDADLGAFSGRLSKDRWIEQAKLLAAGDTATYETQFGKLG